MSGSRGLCHPQSAQYLFNAQQYNFRTPRHLSLPRQRCTKSGVEAHHATRRNATVTLPPVGSQGCIKMMRVSKCVESTILLSGAILGNCMNNGSLNPSPVPFPRGNVENFPIFRHGVRTTGLFGARTPTSVLSRDDVASAAAHTARPFFRVAAAPASLEPVGVWCWPGGITSLPPFISSALPLFFLLMGQGWTAVRTTLPTGSSV
ncbi:hypothetical protein C8F04DRAFT_1339957 [Mycena alexandri]|uniref:Uncharacterized protein n=1 Tax=Mycena alexandri TaxID=1745969 RepID=A0AAD6RXX7_9AGAR|nr:hypothetical protein C8F04DRAFT_1339957 [Mycena alexandri]